MKNKSKKIIYDRQEKQYQFPYHHLPLVDNSGNFYGTRGGKWGYGYLCNLYHTSELVNAIKPGSLLDVGCGDGRFLGEPVYAVRTSSRHGRPQGGESWLSTFQTT